MSLLVEEPGPLLLVQDLGRAGSMHLGVPPSGALDPDALAQANRLVGNDRQAAGLEILLGGVRIRAEHATRIAVTGALVGLSIGGRAASWGTAESVRAGELVEIDPARKGIRSWLAVAGGIDTAPVLGSRSTDTLSRLGPEPVVAGDRLPVGPPAASDQRDLADPTHHADAASAVAVPRPHPAVVELPLLLGPRRDWFTEEAVASLFDQEYAVEPDSSRTALRLAAGRPLERRRREELPSEGIVTGAVQVPASGQPLVFLADHPVTGGYPVIGVVSSEALAACAQARPGDRLRFRRSRPQQGPRPPAR
jgi:biotin-dependent carboxylase-like uncharacterized protein